MPRNRGKDDPVNGNIRIFLPIAGEKVCFALHDTSFRRHTFRIRLFLRADCFYAGQSHIEPVLKKLFKCIPFISNNSDCSRRSPVRPREEDRKKIIVFFNSWKNGDLLLCVLSDFDKQKLRGDPVCNVQMWNRSKFLEMSTIVDALPYDVYNSEEAREIVAAEPKSFLQIDRAETLLPKGTNPYSEAVYKTASETLNRMIDEGSFLQDKEPCYYLYALTMNGRTQTGLVGCASIDDYCNNVILKHENTLEAKEQDRIRHIDACSAQTGPIFLAYRADKKLGEIIKNVRLTPEVYDFTSDDGIRHEVWRIDKMSTIVDISKIFEAIPHLYIADGHHRAASAVKVGLKRRAEDLHFSGTEEYNYFLSVLFPADELAIYDYNRVVTDMNGYTFEQFLDTIKSRFDVALAGVEAVRPQKKGEFGMYADGNWYRVNAKADLFSGDPVKDLDVSVLQDHILSPVLGISDPRTDSRIRFIGGIRGLDALKDAADQTGGIAFAMYPTSMTELMGVADAGLLMPPKSTWFEPKLRSGLFIHRF